MNVRGNEMGSMGSSSSGDLKMTITSMIRELSKKSKIINKNDLFASLNHKIKDFNSFDKIL